MFSSLYFVINLEQQKRLVMDKQEKFVMAYSFASCIILHRALPKNCCILPYSKTFIYFREKKKREREEETSNHLCGIQCKIAL